MTVDIEQRVDDLLKHTGVWDETKATLRELLAEHKAGTLDAEDAKYIEGLHRKMFPGRNAAAGAPIAKPSMQGTREVRDVRADNDDTALPRAPSGLTTGELLAALRRDIDDIVTPADMPETERLRATMRADRPRASAHSVDADDYDEIGCRLCPMSAELAARIGVANGDIVEYVPARGPHLKAWARVDAALSGASTPLGPRGRAILKLEDGQPVWIRPLRPSV